MPEKIKIVVNGTAASVSSGVTVAAALLQLGHWSFRKSVTGEARGPICGMGVCFECQVSIDGRPHQRSCQTGCCEGMRIEIE